jgi:hypothetical protein
MKPIGQTFYINESATGVPGVFITKVDIFFRSVSTRFPIELQIRTTLNGVPTSERLPYGSKILYPENGSNPVTTRPVASADASLATTFVFDTPVFVESAKSYALVLIPVGGNPDYQVWVGEISKPDVSNPNSLIHTNNDTGDLFLSSNDRSWIPVITEDLKFNIYIAKFVDENNSPITSGRAVIRSPDEEYFELTDIVGEFTSGEPLYPSNAMFSYGGNDYNFPTSYLTLTGVTGTFNIGDTVYQTGTINSTDAVTSTGKIYYTSITGSGGTIGVSDLTTGSFSASYPIWNTSNPTLSYATVSPSPGPAQSITTTAGSKLIGVPDNRMFTVDDNIVVSTNTYTLSEIVKITAIPTGSQTIQVNTGISFTDTDANLSKVMFNGLLRGGLGALENYYDFTRIIVDESSATLANNFTSAIGGRITGLYSKASAILHDVVDVPYNQISPSIAHIAPANTGIDWRFAGIKNAAGYANDAITYSSTFKINEGTSNEFIDFERVLMSRSNELIRLGADQRTVNIFANLQSSNTMISPTIDTSVKLSTLTRNLCEPSAQTMGYYLNINNANGIFQKGDIITQGNATGNVQFANTSYVRVIGVSSAPVAVLDIVANSMYINNDSSAKSILITNADKKYSVNDYLFYSVPTSNTPVSPLVGNTGYYVESVNTSAITLKGTIGGSKISLAPATTNPGEIHSLVTSNVALGFVANSTTVVKSSCTSINATVSSSSYYSESLDNGYFRCSRYISKNVILSDTQYSEDILVYLGAYRPSGTDFQVYARIKHNQDSQTWQSKHWSKLSELTPATLLSSTTNIDDQLELQYGFPKSVNLFPYSTSTVTDSTLVKVFSTADLYVGQIIYINDVTTNSYNVRQIVQIVDSSRIIVDKGVSFTTTTAAFGTIPIATKFGAFLNDQNNNIVRYVSDDDHVFDSYSQFAMKIVPICTNSALVPRVSDMRVLALQV